MEQAQNSPSGLRRSEDIALDLLKFVASVAGVGRTTTPSTGFTTPSAPKQEDQITHLLELYTRCLRVVEDKA
ncbi:hypothetical protein ACPOL_4324 [Acidisarcina polymorpha]|uniref:Uncharacterized protein n=1 Tax=Acidisarcina polymorpha TaxID=2211140 RepID=A0A2Z5G3F4_9BACT|nr:hypothetical protein [Acidisarcina polymorpha]AXC13599.1 hypothetical protein ACPOL_4324 [Acidisarcina polymorpha]